MKRILNALLVVLFSHLMIVYLALLQSQGEKLFSYAPDAPWWLSLQCFIAQWVTLATHRQMSRKSLPEGNVLRLYAGIFALGALVYVVVNSAGFLLLERMLWEILWMQRVMDVRHILHTLLLNLIVYCVVGGLTLAYCAIRRQQEQKMELLRAEMRAQQLRSDGHIRSLQQQIDPHFLFNNLNVLSALIQRNSDEAEDFLNTFADIYRYNLEIRDKKLVPLESELRLAQDYMYLLERRYYGAYRLQLNREPGCGRALSVPFGIQMLLENVVKHNEASCDDPLTIILSVTEDQLEVSNPVRPKKFAGSSMAIGLDNLKQRCRALVGREIEIDESGGHFAVRLPLLGDEEMREVTA